jgi:hypothetical protein
LAILGPFLGFGSLIWLLVAGGCLLGLIATQLQQSLPAIQDTYNLLLHDLLSEARPAGVSFAEALYRAYYTRRVELKYGSSEKAVETMYKNILESIGRPTGGY